MTNISDDKVTVELTLDGYKSLTQEITLDEDFSTESSFNLIPVNRRLVLTVHPWGNVYLDGALVAGRVTGTESFMIPSEQYTLSVVHPSYGSWRKTLDLNTEGPLEFTVDFRERASLSIWAYDDNLPLKAEVIIDGHHTQKLTPLPLSFLSANTQLK